MMETQTQREPCLSDLLVYPTSRCNLRCRHCYFAPSYDDHPGHRDDEISYEQICHAVDVLLPFGLRLCKFSGGEPFLREDLIGLCSYVDSCGIRLVIETNGTLVQRHQADTLGHLRHRPFVSVSVDGATAETHEALRGVPGCFRQALQGVEHLVHAGLNVQVIAAAYEGNKSELTRIMEMSAALGAGSFKVCFVHATGRARNLSLIGSEEVLELDAQLSHHARSVGIRYCSSVPVGLQSATHILDFCAFDGRCNITSALGILADGTITICGMGRYTADFRFGKLGEADLARVWTTHPVLATIREGIPSRLKGICGRCVAKAVCLGCCSLENETTTVGSLFDPYRVCAEIEKRGLFRESRIIAQPQKPKKCLA